MPHARVHPPFIPLFVISMDCITDEPLLPSVDMDGQPAAPIPLMSIVPPVIAQSQDTLMTATHPFVAGVEKLSVPPDIVSDV